MSADGLQNEAGETVMVECFDARGRQLFRDRFALANGSRKLTVGRSVRADVTLDDDYAAAVHALLEFTPEGRILVSDLGSANGIVVGGHRLQLAQRVVLPGNEVQIGRSRLRFRSAREILPPEKPDHFAAASLLTKPGWLAGMGALAAGAQIFYGSWLGAPRDLAANAMTVFLGATALLGIWIAFWALLSRVMRGEWRWLRHAAICFGAVAILNAFEGARDLAWFTLSLPPTELISKIAAATAAGTAVCLHLVNASTLSRVRAAQIAAGLTLLLLTANYWMLQRPQERNVNFIDAGLRIYPPQLRLSGAINADAYLKSLSDLREAADQKLVDMLSKYPDLADDNGDGD